MYRIIEIAHTMKTKANDCWYARVQMLKTWKANGVKSQPQGEHTMISTPVSLAIGCMRILLKTSICEASLTRTTYALFSAMNLQA